MDIQIHVYALGTWLLWLGGLAVTLAVATGGLTRSFSALGVALVVLGSTLFIRHALRRMERREQAAFALGRRFGVANGTDEDDDEKHNGGDHRNSRGLLQPLK